MPLNHRRLFYFRAVAHEGGVTAASKVLHVSQPSISAQVAKLEKTLGYELFDRSERPMALTPEGKVVLSYADEIHRLSRELEETIEEGLEGRPMRLVVGLAGTIPNLVAYHLLEPAFGLEDSVRVVVHESRTDELLAELATQEVDLVLADKPIPPGATIRAFNHPLGFSPVDILGPPLVAHRVREGFPESLDGVPFLLPAQGYTLRRSLEDWFTEHGIQPHIVAEIEDNDLINVLGEAGAGLFAAPRIILPDIQVRYAVERVGPARGLKERFYAITLDRHIRHPAVVAITDALRIELAEITEEE